MSEFASNALVVELIAALGMGAIVQFLDRRLNDYKVKGRKSCASVLSRAYAENFPANYHSIMGRKAEEVSAGIRQKPRLRQGRGSVGQGSSAEDQRAA
jgi:hypothetical protein